MGRVTAYIALAALIGVATGLVLHGSFSACWSEEAS